MKKLLKKKLGTQFHFSRDKIAQWTYENDGRNILSNRKKGGNPPSDGWCENWKASSREMYVWNVSVKKAPPT